MQKRCQTPLSEHPMTAKQSPPPPPSAKRRRLTLRGGYPPFLPSPRVLFSDNRSESPTSIFHVGEGHNRSFRILKPRRSVFNAVRSDRSIGSKSFTDDLPPPPSLSPSSSQRIPDPESSAVVIVKPTTRRENENEPRKRTMAKLQQH